MGAVLPTGTPEERTGVWEFNGEAGAASALRGLTVGPAVTALPTAGAEPLSTAGVAGMPGVDSPGAAVPAPTALAAVAAAVPVVESAPGVAVGTGGTTGTTGTTG